MTRAMPQNLVCSLVLGALMLVPLSCPASEEQDNHSGAIVISPVHVISIETGEITSGQSVIIRDGLIDSIVSHSGTGPQSGATQVDGKNAYLIPGLAEMHAHIPSRSRGEQYTRDILLLYLANGITTTRGMLGEPWHIELREKLESQEWTGPRLVTSGPSFNGRSVSSPEQAAEMVRLQSGAGYDFLKLHPGLESEEFAAIANTANDEDIPFAGHVSFEVGLDTALKQHQATIDHLDGYAEAMVPESSPLYGKAPSFFGINLAAEMESGLAPPLARATATAGVWNVPTLSLIENMAGLRGLEELLARPGMQFVSEELRQRWINNVNGMREQYSPGDRERFLILRRTLIRELQAAGAGLLLRSDAPQIMTVPGYSIHEELAYMVGAGLTPLEALRSGTLNVATFFGNENHGEVKPGYVADLVLLQSNPLDDITATTQILGVMRGGTWFSREDLDTLLRAVNGRDI